MSNYSDLHNQLMTSYQSLNYNENINAAFPASPNQAGRQATPVLGPTTTRYLENRNLQQVAVLTDNEMRVLCQLPPNQSGVLISLLMAFNLCTSLAFFEISFMPLIIQADVTDGYQVDNHFGFPLLTCVSLTSAVSYFVFRRFINENSGSAAIRNDMPSFSDRSFLFISLLLAIIGSVMLINYSSMGPLATIGFTIFAMSLVIGVKSIIDLYVKLIGISSLLDS